MHIYLKSIGFSKFGGRQELDNLITGIVHNPDTRTESVLEDGTGVVEYSAEFADNIGIIVLEEHDKGGDSHLIHYFPYLRGMNESCREDICINKRIDTDTFTGMCDDFRLGVSLIFYLQNTVDYLNYNKNANTVINRSVMLSALALNGKVILPTEKNEKRKELIKADLKHRERLLTEARKGNPEAIETLTIEDIDQYTAISKRIKYEDVFSIVETSFMPCGSESDVYNILGIINSCYLTENKMTSERVYVMQISCNNVIFDVCANEKDITGIPAQGMRFRGSVWMQGHVEFV